MTTQDPMIHIREVLEGMAEKLLVLERDGNHCDNVSGRARAIRETIRNLAAALDQPSLKDDVRRRLLSVADTLETAKGQAFAIDFKSLAHDIRELANTRPSLKELRTVGEDASEPPLLSEQHLRAGADHAPGSAARDGSEAPSLKDDDVERVALNQLCAKVEADAVAGLRYIERRYGRLEGVGWDRVFSAHDDLFERAAKLEAMSVSSCGSAHD